VAGRAGVPVGALAAVLNVTVTEAQGAGFVTVFPCGSVRPVASSLNYGVGSTIPNGVIAKLGDGGKVCLFVSNGTHLIADVTGYFPGVGCRSGKAPDQFVIGSCPCGPVSTVPVAGTRRGREAR
jgi:hypothetical protein